MADVAGRNRFFNGRVMLGETSFLHISSAMIYSVVFCWRYEGPSHNHFIR